MKDLYCQLLETARNAGINIVRREKAAKLLALCFAYGDEPFVLSEKLHADTMAAADVLRIGPMKIPTSEDIKLINNKYREVVSNKADWKTDIETEYGVIFPEYRDGGVCISESINREAGR